MRSLIVVLLSIAVTACSTTPTEPALGHEASFDGLRRVSNSSISQAWIRPDLDLSGYTEVLPMYAGTQYVPTKPAAGPGARAPFPISATNRGRIDAMVKEVFDAALAKSERFTVTSSPGPKVLTVMTALADVESNVPPSIPGRSDIYLNRVGAATLVLELRDSESNAVLARFFDRRAAASGFTGAVPSNAPRNTAEVRAVLVSWSERLRQRLDEVPSLTPADD